MDLNTENDENKFLNDYDSTEFKRPNTTVDVVIFTIKDNALHVLTIKREKHPFQDCWSLVGGFVDIEKDRDIDDTARRKLFEKTGVTTPYLEQYKTLGNSVRDPRGWTISTIYFALISSENVKLKMGSGAVDISWSKIEGDGVNKQLAFDHAEILSGCLDRLRSKVMYTSLPVYLLPEEFTLSELQAVYEVIMDKHVERKSFHRRMLNSGIIEETDRKKINGHRPGQIYRVIKRSSAHYFSRSMGQK